MTYLYSPNHPRWAFANKRYCFSCKMPTEHYLAPDGQRTCRRCGKYLAGGYRWA